MCKKYYFLITILFCSLTSLTAQNLLINGDFESGGNGVGFNINSCCYNAITQPFSGNTTPEIKKAVFIGCGFDVTA